jgi:predicted nucleic acid-binding protein
LGQADTLIGASALIYGATLVTGNAKHFPMPELTVEDWSHP